MNLRKACFSILFLVGSLSTFADDSKEVQGMLEDIDLTFNDYYAPKDWKKQKYNWDLTSELTSLELSTKSSTKISEVQDALKRFFINIRDYHTSILFADTSSSRLDIGIKYINGDFYLAYIAPSVPANFPIMLGDKITKFNEVDIKELALSLIGNIENPSPTDWALAARKLTARAGMLRDKVEKGSVVIKAERDGKENIGQLVWNYNKNIMKNIQIKDKKSDMNINQELSPEAKEAFEYIVKHIESRAMKVSFTDAMKAAADDKSGNPLAFGSRDSFLPSLGSKIIWSTDESNPWQAYIYQNSNKQFIGFIRLPTFSPGEEYSNYAEEFGKIIAKMEDLTDALVIDQQNNPGGSVFYLYALASMLSDKPLRTPHHRFTLDSEEVWQAQRTLQMIDILIHFATYLGQLGTIHGYPADAQFFRHMKSYLQFIVEQYEENKFLTDPYFLYGVDYIQPHPTYNYTKKIVLVTNELDFSGGDFFPAILKDSGRASLIGSTTAGAGGYVLMKADKNRLGVLRYSYTGSHAIRSNGEPLEDLGVSPDVAYQVTPEDLKSQFEGFKKAIEDHVNSLIKDKELEDLVNSILNPNDKIEALDTVIKKNASR